MRHKYNAKPVQYGGYRFDSLAERDHYQKLLALEQAGQIVNLQVHPRFELQKSFIDSSGKRQRAIIYEADFSYWEVGNPLPVVADTKGIETPVFKLKKKMFLFKYPAYELRVIK